MALRRVLGLSDGELMRADSKPCSRLMRQTAATVFTFGGAMSFWILCRLHYGPRITVPRSLRWPGCLWSCNDELNHCIVRWSVSWVLNVNPGQNIAAFDKNE